MSTPVILLERVENLGQMGEIVSVKPGYARNYLIPQKKALRASKDNVAYFEAQKKSLEAANDKARATAEKDSAKFKDLTVTIIRQSSESGMLYGSVAARDIAEVVSEKSGVTVARTSVSVNEKIKMLGLFTASIALHPEVIVDVTVNVARSAEEAAIQQETGRAVTEEAPAVEEAPEALIDEENLSAALEDDALEAAKTAAEEEAEASAEAEAKAAEKAAVKAEKAAAKAAAEAEEAEAEQGEEEAEEAEEE